MTENNDEIGQDGCYHPEELDDESLMADWVLLNEKFNTLSVFTPARPDEAPIRIPELKTLYNAGLDIFRVIYGRGLCSDCEGPLVDMYMLEDGFQGGE